MRKKMMTAPLVEPHRHNVNCCAAIFGRPELGHFEAQGRAIFSPNFFSSVFPRYIITKVVRYSTKSICTLFMTGPQRDHFFNMNFLELISTTGFNPIWISISSTQDARTVNFYWQKVCFKLKFSPLPDEVGIGMHIFSILEVFALLRREISTKFWQLANFCQNYCSNQVLSNGNTANKV